MGTLERLWVIDDAQEHAIFKMTHDEQAIVTTIGTPARQAPTPHTSIVDLLRVSTDGTIFVANGSTAIAS